MEKDLRILLLEDSPADAELIEDELSREKIPHILKNVGSRKSFVSALAEFSPDVILSDFSLGRFDGMSALRIAKEHSPTIPFIIVTGSLDEETAVRCMKAGAADYILKDHLWLLGSSIMTALEAKYAREEEEKSQKLLQQTAERYQNIVDNALQGIFQCTPDGSFFSANQALARMLGFDASKDMMAPSEHPTWLQFVDASWWAEFTRQIDSSGVVRRLEAQAHRRDRTALWISVSARGVYDTHGSLIYFEGTVEDITEQRATEKKLAMLASFPELNPNPIIELSLDGRITYVNPAGLKRFPEIQTLGVEHPIVREWQTIAEDLASAPQPLVVRETHFDSTIFQQEIYYIADQKLIRIYMVDITERKNAERKIFSEEMKFRSLVEHSLVGIYIIQDGMFRYVNPRSAEIFGYTQDEIILKKKVADLVADEDRTTVLENIRKRIEGQVRSLHYTFRGKRKDGKLVDVEVHGTQTDYNGRPAVIGTLLDITERKRAEQLQNAVYRIAQAADASPQLDDLYRAVHSVIHEVMPADNFYIALYDDKTDLVTFVYFQDEVDEPSPPHKPGTGLTEYILRTGKSLLCTDEVQEELERKGEAEIVGVPSRIWLGVPLIVDKKIIGVMAVQHYTDPDAYGTREQHVLEFVSSQVAKAIDRKRAEEQLRENEERYRSLFEEDLTGNFVSTSDGKLVACNAAFAQIFGFPSVAEALKCNTVELFPSKKHREEYLSLLRKHQKLHSYEAERRRCDGKPVYTVENAIGVLNEEGELIEIKGYIFDNTERKRLEEQLLQAQKMEAVGQLASGIAHDFNNVMSVALTAAQMIKRHSPTPQVERYARMIEEATLRGSAIAKQLLQFSRADAGKLTPISVSQIIHEVRKLLEHSFPKNISIHVDIEVNSGVILGDAGQIHQMLLNLCINARDAMMDSDAGTSGGALNLTLHEVTGDVVERRFGSKSGDHYIELCVSDTGTGISEEVRRRMFDPFFTTKGIGKGTGLGLSIVHGIVKAHGGHIDVESRVGEGTTFCVYLPAVPHQLIQSEEQDGTIIRGDGETILVIEDEQQLRDLVKEMLIRAGYKTIEACDGEEAVSVFRERRNSINLVLSDLGLPKMSGDQVFRELRKVDPSVKVIFSTGFIQEEKKAELLIAGCLDVVNKPYTVPELLRAVRRALDYKP
ncbi:MAG: PAS domain S-box protein [Ignavibacteriae bacterium]|nr:PAS domain S-box protein [Ignavibacteriota bacterium]